MRIRRPQALLTGAAVGALVVAMVVALLTGTTAAAPGPRGSDVGDEPLPSPTGLFVDPSSPAALQARQWQTEGRAQDARALGTIAAQPIPLWATAPTGQIGAVIGSYVTRAHAAGQQPFVVAYHIPDRDCAGFSAGGADGVADYRAWIRELAAAFGGQAATVVLEPDAVPHEVAGCAAAKAQERSGLLTDAIGVLKASGPVRVYLDAGNPGFITDVGAIADALKRSGVAHADGFSLNVANFFPTDDSVAYGRRISDALGGAHFVIDTSRNGNGRSTADQVDGGPSWCNPPGRAIGQTPTTKTGVDRVDAYLWIKRPGESDGPCRPGEPAAGQWMPDYALALVPKV